MFSDKGKLSHLKMVIFQVKAINQHLVDFSFQIFDICRWTKNIIQNVIHHFQPISIHPSTWKINKYLKCLWLLPKFLKDLPIYIFCTTWPWSLLFSLKIFLFLWFRAQFHVRLIVLSLFYGHLRRRGLRNPSIAKKMKKE